MAAGGQSYMLAARKSTYHENCVPTDKRLQAAAAVEKPSKVYSEGDYSRCDAVTQDTIWKQSVDMEKRCLKNWEQDWGFIAEYDAKGEVKEKEEMPDRVAVYSDDVPNTNSGNYGSRLDTGVGQAMQAMEFQFYADKRRRKMGKDLICY